jgi:hypothetical protein
MKNSGFIFTVVLFFIVLGLSAQQDTLFSSNGDVIVGEIKSMNRNVLSFDTDYADSEFQVEWDNVKGLISVSQLIIYTEDGKRYTGNLIYSENEKGIVQLVNSGNDRELELNKIVKIGTFKNSFWDRIYISIDAGYSFTKANSLSQFSMTGRVNYTSDNWRLSSGFNNVATNQDDVDPTTRNESNVNFTRDIFGNTFLFAGMEFLESSEQMLDLRTTSKLGAGYYFVRTNHLFFQGSLGMANANEKYSGENAVSENSFEGYGALEFDAFDVGDFSFRAKVAAFPSFSNKGRIRLNSDVSMKWDLPFDFYIKASFIHNYDSDPLIDGVEEADYVFQTSIGWEWD